jgi:hypothetical protein
MFDLCFHLLPAMLFILEFIRFRRLKARKAVKMTTWKIHPIVLGTKIYDKGMMAYQHDDGQEYVIPIYAWYLEGGDKKVLVDTGEMHPIRSPDREAAVGGKIDTFEDGSDGWGLRKRKSSKDKKHMKEKR